MDADYYGRVRRPPTPRHRGRRAALIAVAVALFALLSMHGWGTHAVHPIPRTAEAASTHDHEHGSPPSRSDREPASTDAGPAHASAGTGGDIDDPHGAGALALCLAILAGLLFSVLLLAAGQGIQVPASLLPGQCRPVRSARDRDPPDLIRLGIVRC